MQADEFVSITQFAGWMLLVGSACDTSAILIERGANGSKIQTCACEPDPLLTKNLNMPWQK